MSNKLREYCKPKKNIIDLDQGLTIRSKYKIMRWKLFQELKELVIKDFDKFMTDVNEDENLIELLLSNGGYELIFDERSQQLKYGLENSKIWKKMLEQVDNEFDKWYREYKKWLDKRTQDLI